VPRIGSYALAATGERTKSGKGLLLGSPQAGFLAPSVFYEVGIEAPGISCEGMTVPGMGPFIGIGWCNNHAWSLVAGNAGDQVDLYVEQLDPNNPHRYLYNGVWLDMRVRTERYVVKSPTSGTVPRIVTQQIWSTVHGPVFRFDTVNHRAYVYRRSQRGEFARSYLGLLALNTGRSFAEVQAGIRSITATYNFVYADAEGNIHYRFTGWQPVRARGIDLRLPVPGTGEYEWRSVSLPFDQMPHVTNPSTGILHVNQGIDAKPIAWWLRTSQNVFVGRIGHTSGDQVLMRNDKNLDIEALKRRNRQLAFERDSVAARLAKLIETALADVKKNEDLAPARDLFEDWKKHDFARVDADHDGKLDHPAIALFGADYLQLDPSPLWDFFMNRIWSKAGRQPPGTYIGHLGQTLAAIESPKLFSQPYAEGWQMSFKAALRETIQTLRPRFKGAPMDQWRVSAPSVSFVPVGLLAPRTMRVVDHGTYSQIVDLGADRGVNILPPGNGRADRATDVAGNTATGELPKHFVDQLELYENWEFKPMQRRADSIEHPESTMTLVYPGPLVR